MELVRLVARSLTRHPLRTLLTVGAIAVALFLLCTLRSLLTTLEGGVEVASSRRIVVQSSVSLYVALPVSYQAQIEELDGVERTCKWQWFGAYFRDPANQFGQFAVDAEELMQLYPEMELVDGDYDAFLANRRGCMIGDRLVEQFGWKVGDTVPLIGTVFPHPEGRFTPWEFKVEAVYTPRVQPFNDRVMFFHWDYFEQTMSAAPTAFQGVGTIMVQTTDDAHNTQVMSTIDALYENGPQRVQATSEAEFTAQYISMFGNVPFFVGTIGWTVLVAILLASVNAMLMAAREQMHDVGVLKALGFTDGTMFRLLIAQAVLVCCVGGVIGIGLAWFSEGAVRSVLSAQFPGYQVLPSTMALGALVSIGLGLLSGWIPAWRANRLRSIEALRFER